ncbi:hypothetical protein HK098_002546 [Nowakowskiella sp. JEL0407]|nr:hypothetical protein HK098_002546 [Nowakowskiella sp. JEL0407]
MNNRGRLPPRVFSEDSRITESRITERRRSPPFSSGDSYYPSRREESYSGDSYYPNKKRKEETVERSPERTPAKTTPSRSTQKRPTSATTPAKPPTSKNDSKPAKSEAELVVPTLEEIISKKKGQKEPTASVVSSNKPHFDGSKRIEKTESGLKSSGTVSLNLISDMDSNIIAKAADPHPSSFESSISNDFAKERESTNIMAQKHEDVVVVQPAPNVFTEHEDTIDWQLDDDATETTNVLKFPEVRSERRSSLKHHESKMRPEKPRVEVKQDRPSSITVSSYVENLYPISSDRAALIAGQTPADHVSLHKRTSEVPVDRKPREDDRSKVQPLPQTSPSTRREHPPPKSTHEQHSVKPVNEATSYPISADRLALINGSSSGFIATRRESPVSYDFPRTAPLQRPPTPPWSKTYDSYQPPTDRLGDVREPIIAKQLYYPEDTSGTPKRKRVESGIEAKSVNGSPKTMKEPVIPFESFDNVEKFGLKLQDPNTSLESVYRQLKDFVSTQPKSVSVSEFCRTFIREADSRCNLQMVESGFDLLCLTDIKQSDFTFFIKFLGQSYGTKNGIGYFDGEGAEAFEKKLYEVFQKRKGVKFSWKEYGDMWVDTLTPCKVLLKVISKHVVQDLKAMAVVEEPGLEVFVNRLLLDILSVGLLHDAFEIFVCLRSKYGSLLNRRVFERFVQACTEYSEIDKACEILGFLSTRGEINEVLLLEVFKKAGRNGRFADSLLKLYSQIKDKHRFMQIDLPIFTSLLQNSITTNNFAQSLQLLTDMQKYSIQPSTAILHQVLTQSIMNDKFPGFVDNITSLIVGHGGGATCVLDAEFVDELINNCQKQGMNSLSEWYAKYAKANNLRISQFMVDRKSAKSVVQSEKGTSWVNITDERELLGIFNDLAARNEPKEAVKVIKHLSNVKIGGWKDLVIRMDMDFLFVTLLKENEIDLFMRLMEVATAYMQLHSPIEISEKTIDFCLRRLLELKLFLNAARFVLEIRSTQRCSRDFVHVIMLEIDRNYTEIRESDRRLAFPDVIRLQAALFVWAFTQVPPVAGLLREKDLSNGTLHITDSWGIGEIRLMILRHAEFWLLNYGSPNNEKSWPAYIVMKCPKYLTVDGVKVNQPRPIADAILKVTQTFDPPLLISNEKLDIIDTGHGMLTISTRYFLSWMKGCLEKGRGKFNPFSCILGMESDIEGGSLIVGTAGIVDKGQSTREYLGELGGSRRGHGERSGSISKIQNCG